VTEKSREGDRVTNHRIGLVVIIQAILSDGITINVANPLDLTVPAIDGVKIVQRALDERVRGSQVVIVRDRNPGPHRSPVRNPREISSIPLLSEAIPAVNKENPSDVVI